MKRFLCALILVAGTVGLLGTRIAQAQGTPLPTEGAAQNGVDVLTRGPIHEAFAEPLTVNPLPNPIIHQKPPAPIEELPPDQKPEGANIQWIPGYFAWDETGNDYIWISGLWRAVPPGRHWMPGHWIGADGGWQWVSGYWADEAQSEVEYLPAPPASLDMGPSAAAPNANSLYAPGTWVYQQNRYLWRPGFWYAANPNWYYTPARYYYTPAGYLFSNGYWDYPLQNRGLLFAPARFSGNVWNTPGWNYQPSYAIGLQGLLSSLFVRPGYNRYYFGNYYGTGYNQQGFLPWFNYGPGRNIPDPLYNYARWNARANPQWDNNLRSLYQARVGGTAPLPPVTLVQQNQFIHNVTVNKTVQIGNKTTTVADPQSLLKQMPMVAPLNKVDQGHFKLQPVTKVNAVAERKAAQQRAVLARGRQAQEAKIISQGVHPATPTSPPARVKVDPSKVPPLAKNVHPPTPAMPIVPKHVEQPIPKHEPIKPIRVSPPPPDKGKDKTPTPPDKGKDKTPPSKGKGKVSIELQAETALARESPGVCPWIEKTVRIDRPPLAATLDRNARKRA